MSKPSGQATTFEQGVAKPGKLSPHHRSTGSRGCSMTAPARTSNSIIHRSINYAAASHLVATAIAHAQRNGCRVCVVVCDSSGIAVSMGRMDDVPPSVVDFATDKAFTAAMSRKSTHAFFERMSSSTALSMGLANRPRLITWEGGLPIVEDGVVIGGLGVSGAAGNEDVECATVALGVLDVEQSA
jgi:glc operon protein GlcG